MRTERFFYNASALAILQTVTLLGGLVLPRLILTTYGSEINGLIASISQFVSYFNYVEAGLGASLIYALYKPLAKQDVPEINSIVSLAKIAYQKTSGIYFFLVVLLSALYPYIVQSESVQARTIILLVLVIGLFGALDFFTVAKYRVLLIADQKEYVISLVSIIAYVFNFTLTVILIMAELDVVLVKTIPIASLLLRSILLNLYFKGRYSFIKYDQPHSTISLKQRWDALIMQISVYLNISAPVVIISIFCSLKLASVFSIYSLVFYGLIAIISIFTAGVTASFGNLLANDEYAILNKVHKQFEYAIFAITTFLYSCAIILIGSFIAIYTQGVTDISYSNQLYGVLFVIWGILFNVRIPYTAIINSAGLYKETRRANITQISILLGLSVILVQFFEINGVLTALIISALYWSVSLFLVANRYVLKVPSPPTISRIIRMFGIVVLAYLPFLVWIEITAANLLEWFVWALGVAAWSGLITLLVNYLLDKQLFKEVVSRLRTVIVKRKTKKQLTGIQTD